MESSKVLPHSFLCPTLFFFWFYVCTGCVSVPDFPFEENRNTFTLCTLLRQPEVYAVLCEIWVECNKVSALKLFNVTLLKPMRLEEFKNTQSQMQLQVPEQHI